MDKLSVWKRKTEKERKKREQEKRTWNDFIQRGWYKPHGDSEVKQNDRS